ncbi:hypothetical protein GGS21DRAFT_418592 [Xylaria nigripes]|nr:hypothetical protein GGS21DRAFT_418592 [Xylaria nigripes]
MAGWDVHHRCSKPFILLPFSILYPLLCFALLLLCYCFAIALLLLCFAIAIKTNPVMRNHHRSSTRPAPRLARRKALFCFALLCFALLCFALLCFALLCFASLYFVFALLALCMYVCMYVLRRKVSLYVGLG